MPRVADQGNENNLSHNEREKIREAVRKRYAAVSQTAQGAFKYGTGKEGARLLGYREDILNQIPDSLLSSFCGVGNPFSLGDIESGSAVLDIGSGAGFDLIVAQRMTGPAGRVCGIDLTLPMIERSRAIFVTLGLENIEVQPVASEEIPYPDETFDIIISNGVINLSPNKAQLFDEIYRVLKRGGRIQFADMVLDGVLPPGMGANLDAWAQ